MINHINGPSRARPRFLKHCLHAHPWKLRMMFSAVRFAGDNTMLGMSFQCVFHSALMPGFALQYCLCHWAWKFFSDQKKWGSSPSNLVQSVRRLYKPLQRRLNLYPALSNQLVAEATCRNWTSLSLSALIISNKQMLFWEKKNDFEKDRSRMAKSPFCSVSSGGPTLIGAVRRSVNGYGDGLGIL